MLYSTKLSRQVDSIYEMSQDCKESVLVERIKDERTLVVFITIYLFLEYFISINFYIIEQNNQTDLI